MSRSRDPRRCAKLGVLFCASTLITPTAAWADAILTATADGSAAALCSGGAPSESLIPGPGSVRVVFGAVASGSCGGNQASASVLGMGEARFGALAGRAKAEANMAFLTPTFVGASAGFAPRFRDTAEILSSTLAPDTPVTLTFIMALDAIAFHGFEAPVLGPGSAVGASASTLALISDIEAFSLATFLGPSVSSHGTGVMLKTFQVDTAVGHHLGLDVSLSISAQVGLQCLGFAEHCATSATAEVLADHTAHFFYQPSGDVRLVSESGHDYAVQGPGPGPGPRPVPEPASLSLLWLGGASLFAATRRRQR